MTRSASPREDCSGAPLPTGGPVAQRCLDLPQLGCAPPPGGPVAQRCICPLTAPTIEAQRRSPNSWLRSWAESDISESRRRRRLRSQSP
jgi:hypothetical protein